MLVLSRKQSETIVFPELGITIEISKLFGNRVSLAVDAPRTVKILRGELMQETEIQPTKTELRDSRKTDATSIN